MIFGDESYLLGFKVEVVALLPRGFLPSEKVGGPRFATLLFLHFYCGVDGYESFDYWAGSSMRCSGPCVIHFVE